MKLATHQ